MLAAGLNHRIRVKSRRNLGRICFECTAVKENLRYSISSSRPVGVGFSSADEWPVEFELGIRKFLQVAGKLVKSTVGRCKLSVQYCSKLTSHSRSLAHSPTIHIHFFELIDVLVRVNNFIQMLLCFVPSVFPLPHFFSTWFSVNIYSDFCILVFSSSVLCCALSLFG